MKYWLTAVVGLALATVAVADPPDARPGFGCGPGAVGISLDRKPTLRFVRLPALPAMRRTVVGQYSFSFAGGQLRSATIHVTSDGPEGGTWSREANADFDLYAVLERRAGTEDRGTQAREYWKLVDPDAEGKSDYDDEVKLRFHGSSAPQTGGGSDEALLGVLVASAAVPDEPLLHVSYQQDLGGANADNWMENHLLLDFRSFEPRVAVSATCGYNEGGGACTAIDSGMMERVDLACQWQPADRDLLCSESSGSAHRDFYLLNPGARAPLRPGEVAAVEEALLRLRTRTQRSVVVRGIGPVSLVGTEDLPSGPITILGSTGHVYVLPDPPGKPERAVRVDLRGLSSDDSRPLSEAPAPEAGESESWTREGTAVFSSTLLHRSGTLTVLRLVCGEAVGERDLVWLGIEDRGATTPPVVDALVVASERVNYLHCGQYGMGPDVVAVRAVATPFDAVVDVQPVNSTDGRGLVWGTDLAPEGGEPTASDCVRSGSIRWVQGKGFDVVVAEAACSRETRQQARYVRIDPSGAVVLTDQPPPALEP